MSLQSKQHPLVKDLIVLHRNKTPINSILSGGAVTFVLAVLSLTGVRAQEAFQLIDNAAGVFYALTYHVLFAIPLFGMRALGVRAP